MGLKLHTIGDPRLFVDGSERTGYAAKRRRFALLCYLAIEGRVTRDEVTGTFWPDRRARRARATLSQTLLELRRDLGEDWLERDGEFLRAGPRLTHDVDDLRGLVEAERFAEAVEVASGEFLPGDWVPTAEFEAWIDRTRSLVGRLRKRAHRGTVADAVGRASSEEAIRAAYAWVESDELDDEAQHTLLELLVREGRRSDAIRQYDAYASLLDRELGVAPLDHTEELIERIRADGSPGRRPAPPARPHPDQSPSDDSARDVDVPLGTSEDMVVLRRIATGSMGTVLLAREPALRRLVAVKVMLPELADDEEARARFEREAQSAARILHPNVATVYRVDLTADGRPFLVMPYVRGPTLAHRLKAEGPLAPDEVRRLVRDLASALAAAHAEGVLHRDVRPGNVLMEEASGRIYLTDFGIAGILETTNPELARIRITRTQERPGTAPFMSPEQLDGRPLTDRSDVYNLGLTGLALLTGDSPRGTLGVASFDGCVERAAGLDEKLTKLLVRCLAPEPAHRPSAADCVRLLDALIQHDDAGDWFARLRERRLPRIMLAYAAVAWIATQVVAQNVDMALFPVVVYHLTLATVTAGLPLTFVLAWYHGRPGRQPFRAREIALLSAIVLVWILVSVALVLWSV